MTDCENPCRDDTEHFGKYINRLSHIIRYTLNTKLTADGVYLTGEQCRLLGYVHRRTAAGENVYQRDIEREFGVKRSTVASILANLEKSGYISRTVDRSDARIKMVVLTEKGNSLDKVMKENIEALEREIARGMTEEERRMFFDLIKRATENVQSFGAVSDGDKIITEKEMDS